MLIILLSHIGKGGNDTYAASIEASGTINATGGAYIRKSASTSSDKVGVLQHKTKVTILKEVFTKNGSTKPTDRWYYITANGTKGYVRSDLVASLKFDERKAVTTDALNYRTGPSTDMTKKGTLKKGASVNLQLPASFSGSNDTWYRAKIGNGTYYVMGDYVKLSSDSSVTSTKSSAAASASASKSDTSSGTAKITTSGVTRPTTLYTSQSFGLKGTVKSTIAMTKATVGVTDESGNWILSKSFDLNSTSFDVAKADDDIRFGTLPVGNYTYKVEVTAGGNVQNAVESSFKVIKSEVAARLLAGPTSGGKARIVYTFDSSNCTRLFTTYGYGNAKVPQGMTFTGSEYYIVFGMSDAQSIVKYSAAGKRLSAVKFPVNMGHPNGITWDPVTKLCYIFRGNQLKIHTWNPSTGKFGTSKTPYSSSGIAYDSSTEQLYASSLTGIRIYSADGKFTHKKLFSRCSHSGKTYVQDCGAAEGFVFHGISGANKHSTNYLDVYRVSDGKYLGSIKVNLDEIESAIVDNDGYVQLLINTTATTDAVWKTPLNVNDLK